MKAPWNLKNYIILDWKGNLTCKEGKESSNEEGERNKIMIIIITKFGVASCEN